MAHAHFIHHECPPRAPRLTGLVGGEVKVRLEVEAEVPEGVPEDVVRTVTENARTLRFDDHGFEHE